MFFINLYDPWMKVALALKGLTGYTVISAQCLIPLSYWGSPPGKQVWVFKVACGVRVQHRLQYIFSEWGKLPVKLTCPAGTSTCPATLLNKGEIGLCPKHYLPSRASQGFVQLAPLPFFCQNHSQLATGPVVMLHAGG